MFVYHCRNSNLNLFSARFIKPATHPLNGILAEKDPTSNLNPYQDLLGAWIKGKSFNGLYTVKDPPLILTILSPSFIVEVF